MKKFKLLKDLPRAKAGSEVILSPVKNNPDVFKINLFQEGYWKNSRLGFIDKKDISEWLEEIIIKDIEKRYDLVFYIPIEFPLEDDGVRFKDKEFQKTIDEKTREVLDDYDIPYITLTGSVEERLKKFYDVVNLFENNSFLIFPHREGGGVAE